MEPNEWVYVTDMGNGVSSNVVSEEWRSRLDTNDSKHATHTKGNAVTGILAKLLIPGKGPPTKDQAIISENGTIVYIGSSNSVPSKYSDAKLQDVPVLMPGM